ncbi:hypothetical protein [Arthrobacter sp. SLBN-122]|uniref:hypothetical protein n=1 Tax=Arthrobacter sp. SLBN-122 TaxID=2768455 RepID=UPI00114F9305|nr:hypothetical protein [Arthrobacter sp. SLBN-122]TQJ35503.1 hypothetical protein FBY36_2772 [Arthrobacter sp. SLBN-122]
MTTEDKARQKRRLSDEQSVEALLAEAGVQDDPGLRKALLQLRALRVSEVPTPSAELAALLGESKTADVVGLEPGKPRKRKHVVFTTLAVAASFSIAGGAAAGNENVRREGGESIRAVIEWFSPPAPATPAPTLSTGAPTPGTAVVSAPASDMPPAALIREPLPAPPSEPAQSATPFTAEQRDLHERGADAPEVPLSDTTRVPADVGSEAGSGARAAGPRGSAAPPEAGGATAPAIDATEPKAGGKGTADRPDTHSAPPTSKAKPSTAR